jgi:hypothetical protein
MEAEMWRLRHELKQTMDMYSSACKEALTGKQKALDISNFFERSLNFVSSSVKKGPSFRMKLSVHLKLCEGHGIIPLFIIYALFSFSSDKLLVN